MEIEDTPLYLEAQTIMTSGPTTANVTWQALVHYGVNQVYQPLELIALNTRRDYVDNFTDIRTVSMMIPFGDYARLIYPNRLSLQITLTQLALLEGSDSIDPNAPTVSETYTAILIDNDRSPTVAQGQETNDIESLNKSGIYQIDFQIYDKSVEQLRVLEIGGGYVNCTLEDVVKTLLTNASRSPQVNTTRAPTGVDLVPVDNTDKKQQVVIPHGTHAIDVADYLQHRYGLYNAGLGSYLQNKNWFVYPLYDTSDFGNRKQQLTLIVLPKRKFSNIERTFDVVGSSVTVLITGETAFKDDSGTQYLNAGSGARFADANTLMDDPITTGDNKATYRRDDNNSEFSAGQAIGVPNIATSRKRITANPFVAFSELAAKNGGMARFVWQNSDVSLIIPGMVVKVTYLDGTDVINVFGVVHHTASVSVKYNGFGNPRYRNETVLDVFINTQLAPVVA